METEKDLLMYYHTSIRNIGLYTSLSFGALGYSRFYRGKDKLYNVALIIFSLVALTTSILISHYLINDFEKYQLEIKSENADKWILLPKTIFYFNIGILLLGVYTLIRQIIS